MQISSIIITAKVNEQTGGRWARLWQAVNLQIWLFINVQNILMRAKGLADEFNSLPADERKNHKIVQVRMSVQQAIKQPKTGV